MNPLRIAAALPALLVSAGVAGAPATTLTVGEGFREPLGYHEATPRFSWKLPPGVQRQMAYRLEVTTAAGRWDSGWVKSDRSTFAPYGGAALRSRDQVRWRVNFRDEKGKEGGWSDSAGFELGLLAAVDWRARRRPASNRGTAPFPRAGSGGMAGWC